MSIWTIPPTTKPFSTMWLSIRQLILRWMVPCSGELYGTWKSILSKHAPYLSPQNNISVFLKSHFNRFGWCCGSHTPYLTLVVFPGADFQKTFQSKSNIMYKPNKRNGSHGDYSNYLSPLLRLQMAVGIFSHDLSNQSPCRLWKT